MKKVIYALVLPLMVVSGIVFAARKTQGAASENQPPKLRAAVEIKTQREQWEATADGRAFKEWEASPAGKKVYAAEAKIREHINGSINMEALVTSLSLPPGSRLGFGLMVRINDDDFIVRFDADVSQLASLHSLKVSDRLVIRSRTVSHAPKYAYPILSGDYVERDGKVVFKRVIRKGGC